MENAIIPKVFRNYHYVKLKEQTAVTTISSAYENCEFNIVSMPVNFFLSFIEYKFTMPEIAAAGNGLYICVGMYIVQTIIEGFSFTLEGEKIFDDAYVNEKLANLFTLDFTEEKFDYIEKKNFMNKTDEQFNEGKYHPRKLIEDTNQNLTFEYQNNANEVSIVKFLSVSANNGAAGPFTVEVIIPFPMIFYHSFFQEDEFILIPNSTMDFKIASKDKILFRPATAAISANLDEALAATKILSSYTSSDLTNFDISLNFCTQDTSIPISPAIEFLTEYSVYEKINSSNITIELETSYLYLQRLYITFCEKTIGPSLQDKIVPASLKTEAIDGWTHLVRRVTIEQGQKKYLTECDNFLEPEFRELFKNYSEHLTKLELEEYIENSSCICLDFTAGNSLGMQLDPSIANFTVSAELKEADGTDITSSLAISWNAVYLRSVILDTSSEVYGFSNF